MARVSLLALRALANLLAVLLDDAWGKQEKEKATAELQGVLPLILPVLKNHHPDNLAHVTAAVTLLSSFSVIQYKYTLKAWRKDSVSLFVMMLFSLICCVADGAVLIAVGPLPGRRFLPDRHRGPRAVALGTLKHSGPYHRSDVLLLTLLAVFLAGDCAHRDGGEGRSDGPH